MSGCGHSDLPSTPLFADVAGSPYVQGTQLIQSRLDARFPKGSSAQALAAYLEQQGLRVERAPEGSNPNIGTASIKYGGFPCGSQVRVRWGTDAAHSVESVDALFSDTGCP